MAKLKSLAEQAHEPVREGAYTTRDLEERDRRAKFGRQDETEGARKKAKVKRKK